MAKIMKTVTVVSLILTVVLSLLLEKAACFLPLTITAATICYHFAMRLAVGFFFDRCMHNHVDYRKKWFQVGPGEQLLYEKWQVKKWKGKLPTYDPDAFDIRHHSWEEILMATCQAELVHEVIILLSFLPLIAVRFVGAFPVFFITSVLAACFDLLFVLMQRYNRPRIFRILQRKTKSVS